MKSVSRVCAAAVMMSALSSAALAQTPAKTTSTPRSTPAPAPAKPSSAPATVTAAATPAAPEPAPVRAAAAAPPAPAPAPAPVAPALDLPSVLPDPEQAQRRSDFDPPAGNFPVVSFGVLTFLQYQAELHEADGYNAFDVTRGYLNIKARLNDRVNVRFTPDVRPTTDASLNNNLALRLEYASRHLKAT